MTFLCNVQRAASHNVSYSNSTFGFYVKNNAGQVGSRGNQLELFEQGSHLSRKEIDDKYMK